MGLLCHGHGAVGFNPPLFLSVAISVPAFSPRRWDLLSPLFWDRPNHTKLPRDLSELRCLLQVLVQGHRPAAPSSPCRGCASTRGRLFLPHPPPGRWKMCELFPASARLPPHRRARGTGDRNGARGTGSTRGSPSSGEDGMRGLPPPRGSIPTPRPGSKVQTPEQHGHPGWFCLLGKRQPLTERRAAKQGRELQPHGQGARGQGSVR